MHRFSKLIQRRNFASGLLVSDPTLMYVKEGKNKVVGVWLASVGATVLGMILLGGYTRLSRAGLSMTSWSPLGKLPPRTTQEWEKEFAHYQEFPEYQLKNKGMSLTQFKKIWFIEWAHRTIGRALAPIFGLPLLYFGARGYLRRRLIVSGIGLFAFGGLQGLIGWWMVKSGLKSKDKQLDKTPRVSPYRLSVHAGFAYIIYGFLLWNSMTLLRPIQERIITLDNLIGTMKAKRFIHRWARLYFLVLISGFFMAGTDSGKACNTFPKIGDSWVISKNHLNWDIPFWKNFTENKVVVHFNHRSLALLLYGYALLGGLRISRLKVPPTVTRALGVWLITSTLQVIIGILAVLKSVPLELGSLHQLGAVSVLSSTLYLMHTVRRPSGKMITNLLQRMQRENPQKFKSYVKKFKKFLN